MFDHLVSVMFPNPNPGAATALGLLALAAVVGAVWLLRPALSTRGPVSVWPMGGAVLLLIGALCMPVFLMTWAPGYVLFSGASAWFVLGAFTVVLYAGAQCTYWLSRRKPAGDVPGPRPGFATPDGTSNR